MLDNARAVDQAIRPVALPRRRPLAGVPGLYFRPRRDGVVGPPYEFSYKDRDRRRRWQVVHGGVEEAVARRDELVALALAERPDSHSRKFEEAAATWLGVQPGTTRTLELYSWALRRHLVPFFGEMCLEEIRVDDIVAFISSMRRQGLKSWTISSALRPLSMMLSQAARRGGIPINPMSQLEPGERPRHDDERPKRILRLDEMRLLLASVNSPQHQCLIELLLASGLRIGEALGLVVGDLDSDNRIIRVEYQLSREGKRAPLKTPASRRSVDIPTSLFERLISLVEGRGDSVNPDALVFSGRKGAGISRKTCRRALQQAARGAGLRYPHPTLHDLRHSHASMLIALGCSVTDVQRRLGHRRADTTLRIYTHEWIDRDVRKREIAGRLESLPSPSSTEALPSGGVTA